jgi:hypothetical protein
MHTADAADLQQPFVTEAPLAWGKMEEGAKRLHVEITVETTNRTPERTWKDHEYWIVKVRDGMILHERRENHADAPLKAGTVKAVNSQHSFILTHTGDDPWIIRYLGSPDDESVASGIDSVGRATLMWPWRIGNWCFPRMCASRGFTAKGVVALGGEGDQLVKVTFEYRPHEEERNFVRGGWVILDPRRYWSIVEYEVRLQYPAGGVATTRCKNFYADGLGDMVVPLRAEIDQNSLGGSRGFSERIEFVRYERRTVPESEFTLEAYGIQFPGPTSRGRLVGILFSAGMLALLVALLLRQRYRKATSS